MQLALKIDVDTLRGTREGVPNLVQLLKKHDARATFLFSLGPDHTGRAIKRALRPGFLKKVQRTSVVEQYEKAKVAGPSGVAVVESASVSEKEKATEPLRSSTPIEHEAAATIAPPRPVMATAPWQPFKKSVSALHRLLPATG